MSNLPTQDNTNEEIYFEVDTDNLVESLLRNVIKGYEEAWNKNNDKTDVKYNTTITNHKVATPQGNKNVAYLRLERSVRDKGEPKLIPNPDPTKPDIIDEGWESKIIHQEVYFFKSVKEQVDPRKLWKEQLYLNCLARLMSAGLEYAELLQRLKKVKEGAALQPQASDETEERLNNIGLVSSTQMPKPLTPDEQKYADWAKKNSEYDK